jgi:uncharacterized protein (TIGR03085 family)
VPDVDQRERSSLCDLFIELGPDAPTLCGDWRTADLAAHLVIRERNLLAGPGILFGGPFEAVTDRLMARELERHGYEGVVGRVRSGPPIGPMAIRPIGRLTNTIEYVVHHEDVRRPAGLALRSDDEELQRVVADLLRRGARVLTARGRLGAAGLTLHWHGGESVMAHRTGSKGTATLSGDPVEVLLYIYGRKADSRAELTGDTEAVQAVENATFGI